MNLSENMSNSFEYAKKLFSDVGRLVILIVLDLIPLVNLIVIGYAARVLRESPGTEAPPILEKYGDMFVDGAKIFVASLIYMFIPLVLIGSGAAALVTAIAARGGQDFLKGLLLLGGTGLVLVFVGVLLAFVMLIVLAAGIAHMIKTTRFGKAFAFGEIFSIIGRIGWIRYLAWVVLVAVISVMVGAIGSIPYIGWVVAAVIAPVVMVFFFRSLGILYSEGAE